MALISQLDLERRVGPGTVARFCDDDGDGVAEAAIVTEILEEASRRGEGFLLPSFPIDAIAKLALDDVAVRGALCDIAADLMGRRRPALLAADGTTPYTAWRRAAEEHLKLVAKNELRLAGEKGASGAGNNRNIEASVNIDPPAFVFAATKDKPSATGGF